ncbi:hypothetical protein [Allopontixanthobacter sediminis]|uniref:Uncharacterized protein n=1 Tax=Allopontixanthobacter sediminis TaxID=1689985 RepID=A0A845B1Q4_9SPHN|nr:hypothetical protein [Allopontixanthobacter sediminis]MXP44505.1 hypothetical protein [Allopontixanthobacter sediminis]
MIEGLSLLAALATPAAELERSGEFEVVTSLVLRTETMSSRDLRTANRYAECLSLPYFPSEAQFAAKRQACLSVLRDKPSKKLVEVAKSLDTVVQQSPGSEASLSVERNRHD